VLEETNVEGDLWGMKAWVVPAKRAVRAVINFMAA